MPYPAAAFLADADQRLASLAAELAAATSPRDAAWVLCEFAGRELDLADVVVYLPEADGVLAQQAAWGPKRAADQVLESRIRLTPGSGIVGACAQQRVPMRVADTRLDPRYVADDQANLSELAVPIVLDGVLLGVLDSEHPRRDFYDVQYQRALQAIADCGAVRLRQLAG